MTPWRRGVGARCCSCCPSCSSRPAASAALIEGTVVRIVDGDTIHVKLGDRVEKVRYIGMNTRKSITRPKERSPEAARRRKRTGLVAAAREARDRRAGARSIRTAAGVRVGGRRDGECELVRQGVRAVMTVPPNVRHQELFVKLQRRPARLAAGSGERSKRPLLM